MRYRGFRIKLDKVYLRGDCFERFIASGKAHGHRAAFMHVNEANCMDMIDAWLDGSEPCMHIEAGKYASEPTAWGRFWYNLDNMRRHDGSMREAGDIYGFISITGHDGHAAGECDLVVRAD